MNTNVNAIMKKFAVATLSLSALAGSTAITVTAVTTTTAVISLATPSAAQAKVICRDKPVDVRHDLHSAIFKYQPRERKGLVRCKDDGPVRSIQMLLPPLPPGARPSFDKVRRGLSKHGYAPDGCSGGGKRGRELFHAACVAHDICYRTTGTPKRQCEVLFRKNMLTIAKHGPVGTRIKALAFVTAVSTAGHRSYNQGQRQFLSVLASGDY